MKRQDARTPRSEESPFLNFLASWRPGAFDKPCSPHGAAGGGAVPSVMPFYPLILEMKKLLKTMDPWLDKATEHATARGYDVNLLLQCRLAPDMFPLVRQFQAACDHAKFAAA